MEKKYTCMLMIMIIALTMIPLPAMSETYEACYDNCVSSCQMFSLDVKIKCIHDCVGSKCHKTHVLPRMTTKEIF
ncbi:hypothetical protein Bca4012_052757 [Brassica carinata]|uniref:BnaC02g39970D protein n=2 Tax=Brassica napus TaxID=3708 RepID=A0A078GI32_BRANA|nr:hypothetical protein HID58_049518 [Brassica napus]CAF1920899.1 unnamed protein product [Brassica napus]CDY25011.1 BnaC02g39970D [Brassica napus]